MPQTTANNFLTVCHLTAIKEFYASVAHMILIFLVA